jgi:hypothetical protein
VKHALLVLTLTVALVLPAAAAASTTRSNPTIGQLQAQVTALKGQVAALKGQVQSMNATLSQTGQAVTALGTFTLCMNAVYFDLFHTFYHGFLALAGQPDEATTPLDDKGTCAALGVTRTPASAYSVTPVLDKLEAAALMSNALSARLPARFFRR